MQENGKQTEKIMGNNDATKHTTAKSITDSKGDERDFECAEPTKGMLPPSARRRAGFTGLLDMTM